ncbi:MAG: flippase-like domain-containing protein [Coriobacteriales bacterium]|nr:flippase-like domain-containing protein [Coriobacteriales bacterium]
MRRPNAYIVIACALAIVALAVVFLRRDQLIELIETMQRGNLLLLVMAVGCQFGKYTFQANGYAAAFRTVGDPTSPRHMLPLVFCSYFMNVIAPSFNTAGVLLVIDDARQRGVPAGRSTSAALLMQITVITGFLVIMVIGFIVLAATQHMNVIWFLLGIVMVFMVGIMAGIMYIGSNDPQAMVKLLSPLERLANRVSSRLRKGKLLDPWVQSLVESFSEAGLRIRENPRQAVSAFVFSTFASTCELLCFCLVCLAFNLNQPPMLVGGYVVGTLFSWVAITPQGAGVVEAMLIVVLAAYGINTTAATTVALAYRGIVFWMPFAIGAVLIHRLDSFRRRSRPE